MLELIRKQRNGGQLTKSEIAAFVGGVVDGSIPDYQIAAFLMAVYFQKMSIEETVQLTEAMMNSGDLINLTEIDGIHVDKHSTGGVGDKTTLILAPLVAAAGVNVAKISGRGLGHTGGTLDKLEAIPGLSVDLSQNQFEQQVKDIGIAICGQSGTLVPADKKLYALRDVTATVQNFSLIASSILSKKFASGADAVVIDIKVGHGAYMKSLDDAETLAVIMKSVASRMNRDIGIAITAMDQPLGLKIGNALEIEEVIDALKGNGPKDLMHIVRTLGSHLLVLAKRVESAIEGARLLDKLLLDGSGLRRFEAMIAAQGGNVQVIEDYDIMAKAIITEVFVSAEDGFIKSINALQIGEAGVMLGAGRETKQSKIDNAAGIELMYKVGDEVKKGQVLAKLYTNDPTRISAAMSKVQQAYSIADKYVSAKPLILKEIF